MVEVFYRLKFAVSAVLCEGKSRRAISLPAGSLLAVQLSNNRSPTGLVEAMLNGQPLMVFAVDLLERADRLKTHDARKLVRAAR